MTGANAVYKAEERLQAILQAVVVGGLTQDPASLPGGEPSSSIFTATGALEPPYDPEALCLLMEHSNSLRQNVDAYATNIDGFGHRLEPAIDFDAEDADEQVGDCIYLERMAARDRGELADDTSLDEFDYLMNRKLLAYRLPRRMPEMRVRHHGDRRQGRFGD